MSAFKGEKLVKPWLLFDDSPVPDDDLDIARVNRLSDQIVEQLNYLHRNKRHKPKPNPELADSEKSNHWHYARYGLFGGLGHGKTSAVTRIVNALRSANKPSLSRRIAAQFRKAG